MSLNNGENIKWGACASMRVPKVNIDTPLVSMSGGGTFTVVDPCY
jgi:hypothetical protein